MMIETTPFPIWATYQYNRDGSLQRARVIVKRARFDRAEYRGTLHLTSNEAHQFLQEHGDPDKHYVVAPYKGE
jgi:hypothetical protein